MENEIIDVAFKELTEENLENKSIDELKAEANTLYNQMELIGSMGMMVAAKAGKVLCVIKEKIPHGEWENWCRDNLNFSTRKANRMMKLANKLEDNDSIFSNPTILSDIGISKVWELLSAPEEVVESVAEEVKIEDISVKELKEELKEKTEAYSKVYKENENLKESKEELELRCEELTGKLQNAMTPPEIENLKAEVIETNAKLEAVNAELKEKVKKAIEKEQKAKEKEIAKAVEEARKEEEEKAKTNMEALEAKTREAKAAAEEFKAQAEKAKKLAENGGNTEIIQIKLASETLQVMFNKCLEVVEKADEDNAGKLKAYLKAVINAMAERLED